MHRCKTFFACGSSAPLRVDREGGTAAWVTGTMAVPSVQGLPQLQELWPYQSLFSSFRQLVIRRPLWLVFHCSSKHSGTYRAPLPGVLLCCLVRQAHRGAPLVGVLLCRSVHQALKGAPWLGSCSVVWHSGTQRRTPGGILFSSLVPQVFDGQPSLLFICRCWCVERQRLW